MHRLEIRHVGHQLWNVLHGKLSLLILCIGTSKVEINEEMSIANNCFNVTWINNHNLYNFLGALQLNKDFKLLLLGQICKMIPHFNYWPLLSPRTRHVKKLQIFFKKDMPILYIANRVHRIHGNRECRNPVKEW